MRWPLTLITAGQVAMAQLVAQQLLLTAGRQHTHGAGLRHISEVLTQTAVYWLAGGSQHCATSGLHATWGDCTSRLYRQDRLLTVVDTSCQPVVAVLVPPAAITCRQMCCLGLLS